MNEPSPSTKRTLRRRLVHGWRAYRQRLESRGEEAQRRRLVGHAQSGGSTRAARRVTSPTRRRRPCAGPCRRAAEWSGERAPATSGGSNTRYAASRRPTRSGEIEITSPRDVPESGEQSRSETRRQAGPRRRDQCSTVMTTFPFLRPVSTYLCASTISSKR